MSLSIRFGLPYIKVKKSLLNEWIDKKSPGVFPGALCIAMHCLFAYLSSRLTHDIAAAF